MKLRNTLFLLSLLVPGAQASMLDHILRFIRTFLDYLVEHKEEIGIVSDCFTQDGVKRCRFPPIQLDQDTISFQVRDVEMRLPTAASSLELATERQLRTTIKSEPITTISCQRVVTAVAGAFHYECDGVMAHEANFVQMPDETGAMRTFGSILIGDDVCRIGPNQVGDDEIICTPSSSFEMEEDIHDDGEEHEAEAARRQLRIDEKYSHVQLGSSMSHDGSSDSHHRRLNNDNGSIIDIMVLWTKKAECLHAGQSESCTPSQYTESRMQALIALAMQETNVAFELSGVNTQLRLVHAYRHQDYVEPTTNIFTQIIRDAVNVDDGEMEDLHAKRILYGADVVHVIAGGSGACGVGHVGPHQSRMFSVSRFSCTTGYYSFGHEIAHNLGAHHDRGTLNKCSADIRYNYGYKDLDAEFRTIMSYGCNVQQCDNMPKNGCPRIQRFSNVGVEYNNKPIGTNASNNVRIINANLKTVAGYYQAMNCKSDSHCNDNDSSTVDTCEAQGVCAFTPRNSLTDAPTSAPLQSGDMESFVVTGVTSAWKPRILRNSYTSAVVVCTVKYGDDRNLQPAVVRIKNVRTNSFEIRLQQPGSTANVSMREVHCIAAEEGAWKLPDGRKMEAYKYTSRVTDSKTRGWVGEKRTFTHSYSNPAVIGQVMSFNDLGWSTFWARGSSFNSNVDNSNFWAGKHVGEDALTSRASEVVGYIVMESKHGTSAAVEIESARGPASVYGYTQAQFSYSFTTPFRRSPSVIVASPLRMGGIDGCWAVLTSDSTSSSFGVAIDEDTSKDSERGHAPEALSYIAFSSQALIRLGN